MSAKTQEACPSTHVCEGCIYADFYDDYFCMHPNLVEAEDVRMVCRHDPWPNDLRDKKRPSKEEAAALPCLFEE